MPWWSWMVIGGLLFGAELLFIEAEFYLVFIGAAAILTGAVALVAPSLPLWSQWFVFAIVSVLSMILFRKRLYRLLRRQIADRQDDLVGERIRLPVDLAPGAECRVDHRGSTWNARNVGAAPIAAGARGRVTGVEGITLQLHNE